LHIALSFSTLLFTTMAAAYKLSYFDIRGLAEVPRLLFVAAGQAFTDDRVPLIRKEDGSYERGDWLERKPHTPYGHMPVLEFNGVKLAESAAIIRFLAKRFGLNGADEVESALIDAGFEVVQDVRKNFYTTKSDAAKAAEFWSTQFPEYIAGLNKNVAGATYFSKSDKLSYTDISIYYLLWSLRSENAEAVDKALAANEKVRKIYQAVEKNDKIAKYVAERKVTPF